MTRLTLALVAACVLLLPTCGSGDDAGRYADEATTTTASDVQNATKAPLAASFKKTNHEAGGAQVSIAVPFGVGTISLEGKVNWEDHGGHLEVTSWLNDSPDATIERFETIFNASVVMERLDELPDALADAGKTPATWVSRPLNTTDNPLDLVLALVLEMSATNAESAQALLDDGLQWSGSETLTVQGAEKSEDVETERFTYGRSTYWVNPDSGLLIRYRGFTETTQSEVEMSFTDHGPQDVAFPPLNDVVEQSDIPEIYQALRSPETPQ